MNAICRRMLSLVFAGFSTLCAWAAPFELAVSPVRFELASKPGTRIGQTLEVQNVGAAATEVRVRTLDWNYSADGGITFIEELAPGSCRPWVTLERRQIRVAARSRTSFRFQIDVPADAPRTECRLMIALESADPAFTGQLGGGNASLSLPVSGRVAVAVYVAVGGAEPKLALTGFDVRDNAGKRMPVVTIVNSGDAHGRLEGALEAVDAKGQKFELVPDGSPIMPRQTRVLSLAPRALQGQTLQELSYPLRGKGQIDWDNGSFKVEAEFK